MTIKKLCFAVLAGTVVLAAPAAFADDDDDGDRKKRRHSERKKKGRNEVHHHHYYYFSRDGVMEGPAVIYREPLVPPGVQAERPAPYALAKPYPKSAPVFPRESPAEYSSARERQRNILEKELAAEQGLLDTARRALAESFGAPERTQALRDDVELHERNIAALRRELSHLGR